jgi:hypothetical protein
LLAEFGMDAFSYISIVPSIIIALGITRLLTGVGKIVERRNRVQNYWVHMLWSVNVFLYMALNWWVMFRWEPWSTWSFPLFIFLLLTPTVCFLLAVILFPDPFDEKMDFKLHFYEDRRWFFALAAVLPPLDFVDTLLKGVPHLLAQGPIYFVTIALITVLAIVAAKTKNQTYHKFFSILFLVYISVFISINLNSLA